MKRWRGRGGPRVALAVVVTGLVAIIALLPGGVASAKDGTLKQIAEGRIQPTVLTTPAGVRRVIPSLSGGVLSSALDAIQETSGAPSLRRQQAAPAASNAAGGVAVDTLGCEHRTSDGNVRVNQDCTFRPQAEESIIYNPVDPSNLLAGQNDGRVGFDQCGIDWSLNAGRQWGDQLPPFRSKLNAPENDGPTSDDPNRNTITGTPGTTHSYDSASDPAVAMDSRGNGYFSCIMFDVTTNASGVFVVHSPTEARGSFFFNIGSFDRKYVVVEDNDPGIVHDKPFLVADKYSSSHNRDNVYVTWTVRKSSDTNCGGLCEVPIYGSMSTDQGHTFSTPEVISGVSPLCFFGNALDPSQPPNACNFDLGPDPTVLPNGDVVVVFNNFNTPEGNPNAQQLAVRCKPTGSSSSGTAKLNCAAPTKVGDDVVVGEPSCDFTFECIPGAYIRTNDFPRINKNVNGSTLYATWQDYRNQEFDIQLARSTDGGVTWSQMGTVNPDRGRDHYFPAIDVAPRGDRDDESSIGISYFRTDRVPDENTAPNPFGCPPGTQQLAPPPAPVCSGTGPKNSDYVLAGTRAAHVPAEFKVLSPPFAPPDGKQTGFNGDYSGLTITPDGQAHPIWSDTRNTNPYPENGVVHDEDVFTTATGLP